MYGSVAGSHRNIALRLIKAGRTSPVGDLDAMLAEDKALEDICEHGHRWWILSESACRGMQVDISLWRNQDQNDNFGTHEIDILQAIVATAQQMKRDGTATVNIGDLVVKTDRRHPAKVSSQILNTMGRYFFQLLAAPGGSQVNLVDELADFHARNVNPRDLTVSGEFFKHLVSDTTLEKAPLVKHYLVLTQFTTEKNTASVGRAFGRSIPRPELCLCPGEEP